ncbi:MAG: MoaD/ThiS family protein [Burkholderiaceae bacterium]|nr:MoaD/ThiS family protein [Burkholderiaceae bacterium]
METFAKNEPPACAAPSCLATTVTFLGDLPSLLGKREHHVNLPQGATVACLMNALVEAFGSVFAERVFSSPGKLNHTVLVFVDGESIKRHGLLDAPLGEGTVDVMLLPMFAGG